MLKVLRNNGIRLEEINDIEPNTWIHLENPTRDEMLLVKKQTNCHYDFLTAPLDLEEMPRVEREDEQLLAVVNVVNETFDDDLNMYYDTIPVGIVVLDDYIITIAPREVRCIDVLLNRNVRIVSALRKNQLMIKVLYQMATEYLRALLKVDKMSLEIEKRMRNSPKNKEIMDLLSLEKTLVYFKSALKANESVIKKLSRIQSIHAFEEDSDLLEDTLIELNQASDMTDINIGIVSGLREASATLVSNNINNTMKVLTSLTVVMAFPTLIFSFYGINTKLEAEMPALFFNTYFILLATSVLTFVIIYLLRRKNML